MHKKGGTHEYDKHCVRLHGDKWSGLYGQKDVHKLIEMGVSQVRNAVLKGAKQWRSDMDLELLDIKCSFSGLRAKMSKDNSQPKATSGEQYFILCWDSCFVSLV